MPFFRAYTMKQVPNACIGLAPAPKLATIKVFKGRECFSVEVPEEGTTVGDLKLALAHICPPSEACLMAKGKKLLDDTAPLPDGLGDKVKVMLMRCPALAANANKKLSLTM